MVAETRSEVADFRQSIAFSSVNESKFFFWSKLSLPSAVDDRTVFNDRLTQEQIPICERSMEKKVIQSADVQSVGIGDNVTTHLLQGDTCKIVTTTVPVSTVFDRFRNMQFNVSGSDYMKHIGIFDQSVSSTTKFPVNHAYLCMNVKDCIIRPEIITFPNSDSENSYQNHVRGQYSDSSYCRILDNQVFDIDGCPTVSFQKTQPATGPCPVETPSPNQGTSIPDLISQQQHVVEMKTAMRSYRNLISQQPQVGLFEIKTEMPSRAPSESSSSAQSRKLPNRDLLGVQFNVYSNPQSAQTALIFMNDNGGLIEFFGNH